MLMFDSPFGGGHGEGRNVRATPSPARGGRFSAICRAFHAQAITAVCKLHGLLRSRKHFRRVAEGEMISRSACFRDARSRRLACTTMACALPRPARGIDLPIGPQTRPYVSTASKRQRTMMRSHALAHAAEYLPSSAAENSGRRTGRPEFFVGL